MIFAATAEMVRYQGAVPLLVDCDPVTLTIDLSDAERKIADLKQGRTPLGPSLEVVGIMPAHYGGIMADMDKVNTFAVRHNLRVVGDAAHASGRRPNCGPALVSWLRRALSGFRCGGEIVVASPTRPKNPAIVRRNETPRMGAART